MSVICSSVGGSPPGKSISGLVMLILALSSVADSSAHALFPGELHPPADHLGGMQPDDGPGRLAVRSLRTHPLAAIANVTGRRLHAPAARPVGPPVRGWPGPAAVPGVSRLRAWC